MPTLTPYLLATAALFYAASAQALTTLHSFTNADGSSPSYAMTPAGGVLYGTTAYGGTTNQGTLFKLDPITGMHTVLYNFVGGTEAALPLSPLVFYKGALYGSSTFGGGALNDGTVYKFDLATNTETVLHGFSGTDGAYLRGALVIHAGHIYGTASYAGRYKNGTLFSVTIATGATKVLHHFALAPDGAGPEGGLTYDAGTIYGTTLTGGQNSNGTIFSFSPATHLYKALYSFSVASGDGSNAALLVHNGALYGTGPGGAFGSGCVFKFNPVTLAETVLYSFTGFADGFGPYGGVVYHGGALYGTTQQGGSSDNGTVFSLALNTHIETVLYSFSGGADGNNPAAGLVYSTHNFFGSTGSGGTAGYGTLFEIP